MRTNSRNYVFRIISDEYENMVFSRRCYYTGLRRRFAAHDLVFFLMKKKVDSFVGYGEVSGVRQLRELDGEERDLCIERNWYTKLEFEEVRRFAVPLPLKFVFPGLHKLGKALHGLELNPTEGKRIIELEKILAENPSLLNDDAKQL